MNILGIEARPARIAWTWTLMGLLFYIIFVTHKTLIVFTVALLLSCMLHPMVKALESRLPNGWKVIAVAAPFCVISTLITAVIMLVMPSIWAEITSFGLVYRSFWHFIEGIKFLDIPFGKVALSGFGHESISFHQIRDMSSILTVNATDLLLIPILSYIMLNDGNEIRKGVMKAFNDHPNARLIMHDGHALLVQYMRALLTLCFAAFVSFLIALSALHVPYAFILAFIAFPLEFLPLVGPLASAAIILAVCAFSNAQISASHSEAVNIALVGAFLIIYRLFQDYVLSPHLMRKSIQLHPLIVLFGVFAGADIDGIGGVFLSVPVLAVFHLVYKELREGRLGRFDSDPPVEVRVLEEQAS